MSAEQLLEQMEIFEKAKNDYIEFEQSHQSTFKDFLKQFGFNDVEIKSIITGDNINKLKPEDVKNGEISAKNEIITLFGLYNEISILQTEKIRQININAEASADDELKTIHFENLAKTINQIPMDYYRKVSFEDNPTEKTDKNQKSITITSKTEQEKSSQQNQQSQNTQKIQNSQQTQKTSQQQQKPINVEPKQNKGVTITPGKQTNNIQITKNQNTPQKNINISQKNQNTSQKNINISQKNQNTSQKNQNTSPKNQGQGYAKKNNPQQNQNQGSKPKYTQNQQGYQPKYTPTQNQSQTKYTPPPPQQQQQSQKPSTNTPLRIEKPNIQINTNNAHKIEKPNAGGKVSIQLNKKTGGNLFDKK